MLPAGRAVGVSNISDSNTHKALRINYWGFDIFYAGARISQIPGAHEAHAKIYPSFSHQARRHQIFMSLRMTMSLSDCDTSQYSDQILTPRIWAKVIGKGRRTGRAVNEAKRSANRDRFLTATSFEPIVVTAHKRFPNRHTPKRESGWFA